MEPDEIDYVLKIIGEDSESPRNEIVETLARLPADVCRWVVEHVAFMAPPDSNGVAFTCPWGPTEDGEESGEPPVLRIAYLAPRIFEESSQEIQRVIAHEVAHHWLRHSGPAAGGDDYQRREDEVEMMLKTWGVQT